MKKSGITTGVLKKGFFWLLGRVLPGWAAVILAVASASVSLAQDQEAETSPQPSQTRAKTFVPSPSASDRTAGAGQIKILEIEYSSRRQDVPINEDKIRQNMRSSVRGLYSQQTVDGDIESLYATG